MKITAFIYKIFLFFYYIFPFKKGLCTVIKYCKIPNHKFYKDLKFKGTFNIKLLESSFRLYNTGGTIENEIFWKGIYFGWEKESMKIWEKLCRRNFCIFDIGSNTGVYALIAGAVNPEADVYAFEPVGRTYNTLIRNKNLNDFSKLHCSNFAISDKTGESILFVSTDFNQLSASLNKDMPQGDKIENIIVPVTSVKAFILENNIKKIDLVKIDVELHEPEVLDGMVDLIELHKPDFLIEILTDEIGERIQKFFSHDIYDFFMIDEISSPIYTLQLKKSKFYNYLICKKKTTEYLNLNK